MRVALVHDWLVTNRGGEKVLDALLDLFPEAEIFTLIHKKGVVSPRIDERPIHTSFLQRVPGIYDTYRHFLPAFPRAIEAFDLSGFDLVVSSSHCVAKGVRIPKGARHLAFIHAPMRYMWDRFDDYFGADRASPAVRAAALAIRGSLQAWDRQSSQGIHRIVANSHHVAGQIASAWGRQASVVHPPAELDRFARGPLGRGAGGYFLVFGALAPYKRVDVAIEAFRGLDAPLWIAGGGQDLLKLRRDLPSNVKMIGSVTDDELPSLYADARALVFPGVEDFGITPIEAQACGRPVIAFGTGGAMETLTAETAVFFDAQNGEALRRAVRSFEVFEPSFDPARARKNASRFSRAAFIEGIGREVEKCLAQPA